MPEYLSPGVYVEEVDTGNKPIEGVATSTVGFLGITERGPTDPMFISNFGEYRRTFGGYVKEGAKDRYLTYGVEGFFQNGGKRCFVARVVSNDAATKAAADVFSGMQVTAIGPGKWGERIAVKISKASLDDATAVTQDLFKLTVMYWSTMPPIPLVDPTDPANNNNPNRVEPTVLEVYDNLLPTPNASNFYKRQVNGSSVLVVLELTAAGRPVNTPAPPPFLKLGNDGVAIDADDFSDALNKLEQIDEIAILCCPDENDFAAITDKVVSQCENLKDRFAIIQAPNPAPPVSGHRPSRVSKYAAYYHPWLRITNPVTQLSMEIPPGGHVSGIYARSDIERGVHKAPANEIVRGLFLDPLDPTAGLKVQVTRAQQDLLNPRGVNVIRFFPGRGNLVWGARTTTLDPDWKYVNVRRLFIFVEESIEEATQWVVFEPNDEPLWARVRGSVSAFLTRLWMDGMLQGKSREEAYFVKCDRTTMTQADIDNGRLIMLVGIAPVKPAEFVIFRIGQWTGGSEVTEG
jgi:phage tail sheath protein FI